MENTPNRLRNRGLALTVTTSGLNSLSRIENNNRTQARGVAFTNNDVHGTAGTPEAVGENVLNSSYNGSRAFNGSNGGYGLNDTTGNMDNLNEGMRGLGITAGASGVDTSDGFSMQLQAQTFSPASPFSSTPGGHGFTGFGSSRQQAYPNLPAGLTPDSPITPNVSMGQVLGMSIELGRAQAEVTHLRSLVKDYQDKEKNNLRQAARGSRQSTVLNTPSSTNRSIPRSVRNARSGISLLSNALTVGTQRSGEIAVPLSPTPRRTPVGPMRMNPGSGRSGRRGHHRNNTPEQNRAGVPIYTLGIAPQDIRGLLSDFIDEMKAWAFKWTVKGDQFSESLMTLTEPGTLRFLGDTSTIYPLVADRFWRVSLVAAIVSRDIFYTAVSDHFLFNSQHDDSPECDAIFNKYEKLGPSDVVAKHRLLQEQKALYMRIKEQPSHREWRTTTAQIFSNLLVDKLKGLINTNDVADRDQALHELFIKGYRIGFRLRTEATKWQMRWPCHGEEFEERLMVNESRTLCGDVLATIQVVSANPHNFAVRFATSPTIRQIDFSSGSEQEQIIHKALVHLARKAQHIGAERGRG